MSVRLIVDACDSRVNDLGACAPFVSFYSRVFDLDLDLDFDLDVFAEYRRRDLDVSTGYRRLDLFAPSDRDGIHGLVAYLCPMINACGASRLGRDVGCVLMRSVSHLRLGHDHSLAICAHCRSV